MDPSSGQSTSDSQRQSQSMEFLCPYCGKSPDSTAQWIRTSGSESAASQTVQLLLDDEPDADGETITGERIVLLQPCRHSFRRQDLSAVRQYLRVLDDLRQRHDTATGTYERQQLCEEIHAVGAKLDAAIERCETHMDATRLE